MYPLQERLLFWTLSWLQYLLVKQLTWVEAFPAVSPCSLLHATAEQGVWGTPTPWHSYGHDPVASRSRPWLHQLTPEPRHFPSQIPVLLDQGVSKTTPKRKGLWSRKYSCWQQQLNTWLGCSSVEEVLSVRKALGSILDTTNKVLS